MLRVAWKSLMGRKLRLLMSTFAIVLGVAFVAGSLIFTDTLSRSFTAIFESSVGDVVVRPAGTSGSDQSVSTKTIPAAIVRRLANVDGAARADGNVVSFSTFVIGSDNKVVGGQGAPGIALNYTGAPAAHGLKGLTIVSGHAPHGPDEVVLDRATANRAGYFIGQKVHLVTSSRTALLTPTLVGFADFADGGSTNGASIALFDTVTAQALYLDGKDAFNTAWVTAQPGESQSGLQSSVSAALPKGFVAQTGDNAAKEAATNLMKAISFISTFLLIFAGIALVVGSFLIVNTFSILVAQRSRELALLRALGASRRQVTRSVLFEALVLGVVGSTTGLALGVLLAIGIRLVFASFGLDLSGQPLVFLPRTVVASYVVGVLVTVLAAYLPARRSARIPPIAALRDDVAMPESTLRSRLAAGVVMIVAGVTAMSTGLFASVPKPGYWVGGGVLAALLGVAAASPVISKPFLLLTAWVYRRGLGPVGRLAGQNALRNPRRTAATASALMIGLALVTTMSVVGDSASKSVDRSVAENFLGDLVVSNVIGAPFSPSIAGTVAKTPGVQAVSRIRYAYTSRPDRQRGLMGVDPTTLADVAKVPLEQGSLADLGPGTAMVASGEAKDRNLALGKTLTLRLPNGLTRLRVVAIYSDKSPVLFFPFTVTNQTLRQGGYPVADNYLMIKDRPGADTAAIQRAIDAETAQLPTVTVKDQAGYAAEQRKPIGQLLLLIDALLGLALVIAILGIVNTLALSVIERTREVGLLRAVGVSRRQLRSMVRLEAVAIAVLGALLGVGMGVVFGVALMTSLRNQGLEVIAVPVGELVGFVALAAVLGVLAAVLPARRAARLDVLQAIATD